MSTQPVQGQPNPSAEAAAESPAVRHQPWETLPINLGMGVNLNKSVDALDPRTELARLTNGMPRPNGGGIFTRPGQTSVLTGLTNTNSIGRLYDPFAAAATYFIGDSATLRRGLAGVPPVLEGGFSGNPLTFAPWQTQYGGESWMFVADSLKMRKASVTSPSIPIGLPKPAQPTVTAVAAKSKSVLAFDSSDGSEAAAWYGAGGPDTNANAGIAAATAPPGGAMTAAAIAAANAAAPGGSGAGMAGAPVFVDVVGISGNAVDVGLAAGNALSGYQTTIAHAFTADVSKFSDGSTISDDDILHLAIYMDAPQLIQEIRIYFVCSAFAAGPLIPIPGTHTGTLNNAAYTHAYRPSDYVPFISSLVNGQITEQVIRTSQLLKEFRERPAFGGTSLSTPGNTSGGVWVHYGAVGLPVRRGDFLKIGTAGQAGTDWATITGVIIVFQTTINGHPHIRFDDCHFTGGFKPDTSEPDFFPYDYRVTNVDRRTGAESNPSDVMATFVGEKKANQLDFTTVGSSTPGNSILETPNTVVPVQRGQKIGGIDVMRQSVLIDPAPYGDPNVYQRAYRRGGSINDNWYGPVGDNNVGGDGAPITDNTADITALNTGVVETDHDQPVTTSNFAGTAVLAQPVPIIIGPIDGLLLAFGDPYRPGDVYWCKRDEPDHWPAANHTPVCPPSEVLQNGVLAGDQAFVFSQERLYGGQVNSVDGSVSFSPTSCTDGLAGRWAIDVGPGGIYFVAKDAVRVTQGGTSKILGSPTEPHPLQPLFNGETKNNYPPIDWTHPEDLRLKVHGTDVWFGFRTTTNCRVWWVYSIIQETWRHVIFADEVLTVYSVEHQNGPLLLLGSDTIIHSHSGNSDNGVDIQVNVRTASSDFGKGRSEKLLGDVLVWGNFYGENLTVTTYRNGELQTGATQVITASSSYERYLFDAFGVTPLHAQTLAVDLTWTSSALGVPYATRIGVATAVQPEITILRATQWHPLNQDGRAYVYGAWFDCDTSGQDVPVTIEGLRDGTLFNVATVTLNSNAGRRIWRSWSAVQVDMIRLRPTDDSVAWMLFGQGWLSRPSPPALAIWDTGFESLGDTYYTGVDLECDTFGAAKRIAVEVDGVVLNDPATGLPYWTVNTNGRRYVHLTLPWGRGHIYRFYAIDANLGQLFQHKWLVEAEPGEQHNWNQNFTIAGTRGDKWLKYITLECDTYGQDKSVTIEVDGVVVETLTVNTTGRTVRQLAFTQHLGRVFRLFPTDHNPGRLYSFGWGFDQEPLCLTRFETQEQRHSFDEWHVLTYGQLTYKSTQDVILRTYCYGISGQVLGTDDYLLPNTNGRKGMLPHKPQSRKGVLYKHVVTSAAGFWLYREESWLMIQGWNSGKVEKIHPFGNDDLDPTRDMVDATAAATRPGGMAS